MATRWTITPPATDLQAVADRWELPRLVAQLLLNRGLESSEAVRAFLTPQMKDLLPPHCLPGAVEAAGRIVRAIRERARIILYGDYDVDGTTGLAILWHVLTRAGASVSFYVPHRIEEGYGLNLQAVERLIAEGAELIVTIDCGITAVEVAEHLKKQGVALIVTDHHGYGDTLPPADAIVHPLVGGTCPNPDLSGSAVAFKVAWAIAQQLGDGEKAPPDLRDLLVELLPLAALGTIADVVPLTGENRIIARHGLDRLARTTLPGLRALIDSAGLNGKNVTGYDVGFKLAPRINAAGRMGHARLAVELFTRADTDRAREIALYLEEHNRSRQATERKVTKQAVELVERHKLAGDARRAIVLASHGWHPGVIGIVAARLVDRYHRPAVVIALGGESAQGSARSVRHFDINDAISTCAEHLITHGGHTMAAGLRIDEEKIEAFTEAFVTVANNRLTPADLTRDLRIDAEVSLADLTLPTVETLLGLGPFGAGNPRPRLASEWVELAKEPRCVGKKQEHLQAVFRENGASLKAIGFGLGDRLEDLKQHRRCRVAFEPIINEFGGRRSVEMQMIDLQFPD